MGKVDTSAKATCLGGNAQTRKARIALKKDHRGRHERLLGVYALPGGGSGRIWHIPRLAEISTPPSDRKRICFQELGLKQNEGD